MLFCLNPNQPILTSLFVFECHGNLSMDSSYRGYVDVSDAFWDSIAECINARSGIYSAYGDKAKECIIWLHQMKIHYTITVVTEDSLVFDGKIIGDFYIRIKDPRHAILFKLRWC